MKCKWICLILCLLYSISEAAGPRKMLIYYLPFQLETYVAVTPKNIKEEAIYKRTITSEEKISRMHDLLSSGKASHFDRKRVRLLITINEEKKKVLVDAEGNVYDGKKTHSLGPQKSEQLKVLLSELIAPDQ